MNFFTHFPRITYNGQEAIDITRRSVIIQNKINDGASFLPYTLQGNEKPEDIAFLYYGDVSYTWLVYFSNNILDPYHEWHKSNTEFLEYVIKKYADMSGKKGWDVIAWAQNQTITSNILFYVTTIDGKPIALSKDAHRDLYLRGENSAVLSTEAGEPILVQNLANVVWEPYRVYDYENDLNEKRLTIQLLDKRYARSVESQFIASMQPR